VALAVVMAFSGMLYSANTYSVFCDTFSSVSSLASRHTQLLREQSAVSFDEQLNVLPVQGIMERLERTSRLNEVTYRQRGNSKITHSILSETILSAHSYFYSVNTWIRRGYPYLYRARVIIEYIHHQDGAKG
jgi:hypothetical protein